MRASSHSAHHHAAHIMTQHHVCPGGGELVLSQPLSFCQRHLLEHRTPLGLGQRPQPPGEGQLSEGEHPPHRGLGSVEVHPPCRGHNRHPPTYRRVSRPRRPVRGRPHRKPDAAAPQAGRARRHDQGQHGVVPRAEVRTRAAGAFSSWRRWKLCSAAVAGAAAATFSDSFGMLM